MASAAAMMEEVVEVAHVRGDVATDSPPPPPPPCSFPSSLMFIRVEVPYTSGLMLLIRSFRESLRWSASPSPKAAVAASADDTPNKCFFPPEDNAVWLIMVEEKMVVLLLLESPPDRQSQSRRADLRRFFLRVSGDIDDGSSEGGKATLLTRLKK